MDLVLRQLNAMYILMFLDISAEDDARDKYEFIFASVYCCKYIQKGYRSVMMYIYRYAIADGDTLNQAVSCGRRTK